ncbi:MAG: RNA methyltransferase [Muribaculaceae bacterium]|nr:RNA methyltransferase [Muribaculaceae bacterium]
METTTETFAMIAKTFQGLEDVLAEEIRALPGAVNVEPGRRMVSFEGTKETLYRANMCCRTALRILKPIASFFASDPEELYDRVKSFDWTQWLALDKTFSIDPVVYSDDFTNSRFVTYRVKDAIVDFFRDRYGSDKRPGVRLQDADLDLNVHIAGKRVTLSVDSSGESLHKRGWRAAQTDAPINEVLAAGIILKSGWRGDCPFVDPMCGSGTFLIEAAMIGAGIMPGIYRRNFAFEHWADFDRELLESIYNDESSEKEFAGAIYGADASAKAIEIAQKNIKSAGVAKYIKLETKPLSGWEAAPVVNDEGMPVPGVLVTNPPYGQRLKVEDVQGLYQQLGTKLKNIFKGYHAWVISSQDELFQAIGLAPTSRTAMLNGALECELREYVIFEGDYKSFRASGGSLGKDAEKDKTDGKKRSAKDSRRGFKDDKPGRKGGFRKDGDRKPRYGKNDDTPGKRIRDAFEGKRFRKADENRRYEREDLTDAEGNPLPKRHKVDQRLLEGNKQPSLPKPEGPFMRIRQGWKPKNKNSENPENSES